MKTKKYNPSQLELDFTNAIQQLKNQLEPLLPGYQIETVEVLKASDNPMLLYTVSDKEGDRHELILQVIQRPDGVGLNS